MSKKPSTPLNSYLNFTGHILAEAIPTGCNHSKQSSYHPHTSRTSFLTIAILTMVHELHKAGYQQLRICPGMSPSGVCWRVAITNKGNILKSHGAMIAEFGRDADRYTSGQDNYDFDWRDAEHDTARQLAQKFLERFSDICTKGRGLDHEYLGWYVQRLGFSERGIFPVSYADYQQDHPRWMSTRGGDSDSEISGMPKPPLGFAEGEVI